MGWWGRKKTVIDEQPKTDNLQPNQPAGDASMANTVSINPQTLQALAAQTNVGGPYITTTNAVSGIGTTYTVATTGIGGPNVVYTTAVPQYYQYGQYGTAVVAGQVWAVPNSIFGYDPETRDTVLLTPKPSRSEFTEEEIEQAERLMEELSA